MNILDGFKVVFWLLVGYLILAAMFGWWPFQNWPM